MENYYTKAVKLDKVKVKRAKIADKYGAEWLGTSGMSWDDRHDYAELTDEMIKLQKELDSDIIYHFCYTLELLRLTGVRSSDPQYQLWIRVKHLCTTRYPPPYPSGYYGY